MGTVIQAKSSFEDVYTDARITQVRGRARGGAWASLVEQELTPLLADMEAGEAALVEAKATLAVVDAAASEATREAGAFVARLADTIWNDLGRPRRHAGFALLFPNGVEPFTGKPRDDVAERMAVLATLIGSGRHLPLAAGAAEAAATELRAEAAKVATVHEATRAPAAKVRELTRARTALARTAQRCLARLKRLWMGHGLREVEVHEVIPDRGRSAPLPREEAAPGQLDASVASVASGTPVAPASRVSGSAVAPPPAEIAHPD